MKKFLKILGIVVLAAVVVVGGGILLDRNGVSNPVSDVADHAAAGAANAALDATGIREQADEALRANTGAIARQTGLPEAMVVGMVDDLDIPSWKVVPLPKDAVPAGSSDVDYNGLAAEITTYNDPNVITLSTDAGSVTLEVPDKAQGYVHYLQYL